MIGLRGLFKAGRYVDRACNSFVGGTMVETPDGPKRIELIEEGDWVLTRPQEQPGAPPIIGRVTGVFRNLAPVVLWLTLSTGQVVGVTPTHEFWTYECGWTLAGELHVGETLTGLDGQPMAIVSIVVDGRPAPVYNLEVEGTSTFFAQGVWVHNNKCDLIRRGRIANALGHSFEYAVMQMLNIKKYVGGKLSADGINFVPDFLDNGVIGNIKSMAYVYVTPQLKAIAAYAEKHGLRPVLYVADKVSDPVRRLFKDNIIRVPLPQ